MFTGPACACISVCLKPVWSVKITTDCRSRISLYIGINKVLKIKLTSIKKSTALYIGGFHSPALSGDEVTVGPRVVFDAIWRAIAVLAAEQRMITEALGLTRITGWFYGLRWADTFSCHLVTQSAAAFTCCRRERKRGFH